MAKTDSVYQSGDILKNLAFLFEKAPYTDHSGIMHELFDGREMLI